MLSNRHEQAAQWYGTLHAWVQGPVLLAATVMAPASIMFENEAYCKMATVGAFLFIAIAQGLLYTNDLPGMKERHLNYAARYADLVTDISENLAKSERARQPCAVFTMKVKTAWDALNRTAPRLPRSGGYDSRRAPRSRRAATRVCPMTVRPVRRAAPSRMLRCTACPPPASTAAMSSTTTSSMIEGEVRVRAADHRGTRRAA